MAWRPRDENMNGWRGGFRAWGTSLGHLLTGRKSTSTRRESHKGDLPICDGKHSIPTGVRPASSDPECYGCEAVASAPMRSSRPSAAAHMASRSGVGRCARRRGRGGTARLDRRRGPACAAGDTGRPVTARPCRRSALALLVRPRRAPASEHVGLGLLGDLGLGLRRGGVARERRARGRSSAARRREPSVPREAARRRGVVDERQRSEDRRVVGRRRLALLDRLAEVLARPPTSARASDLGHCGSWSSSSLCLRG